MTPKGKTPSLISGSLGRPNRATAGKSCSCSRCDAKIEKGCACFDVPQPSKPFNSRRRFCSRCFTAVVAKTREDLTEIEALIPAATDHS
jgi:hypothetical protein